MVTTTVDSGAGSLRDAISQVNADVNPDGSSKLSFTNSDPTRDEIDFAITTGAGYNSITGVATIQPQSALPPITNTVIINGYTQGQGTSFPARPNTLAVGDNAVWTITLLDPGSDDVLDLAGGNSTVEGLSLQVQFHDPGIHLTSNNNFVVGNNIQETGGYAGVLVDGASGNTIGGTMPAARNLITAAFEQHFTNGIAILGGAIAAASANNNVVEGNYIGTNAAGTATPPGSDGTQGIWLLGSVSGNTIGGTSAAARNIIAGWGDDVVFQSSLLSSSNTGNLLEGNYIGTDVSGMVALLGPDGESGNVSLFGPGTGANTVADNLIAGGVSVFSVTGGGGNLIEGNLIGTNATGTERLPDNTNNNNVGGDGIGIFNDNNVVEGNTIAFQSGAGVAVGGGTGNRIEDNSIYANGLLGITLGGQDSRISSVNTNAANNQANHQGPNNLMNFPVLTSVQTSAAGTTVNGTLDTGTANGVPYLPNASVTLDFYADPTPDPTGYGQGQTWLGSTTVTTDSNGHVSFTSPQFNTALPAGDFVSATATDAAGDTSEFSADIPVGPTSGGPYTIVAGGSATFHAAAGPATNPVGYFWLINGQSYGSASNFTGYNPTLSWAQLQALGITGPGQYTVQAQWVNSSNTATLLPATTLTVQTAPATAAITTSLPADDGGNPTAAAGTAITLNSGVTDPNTANAVASYAWSVVEHAEPATLGTALVAKTQYATRVLGESSAAGFVSGGTAGGASALGAQDQGSWGPVQSDSAPYLALGFDTPIYADGLTIWENAGDGGPFIFDNNGFVTRVDLLDTNGQYHTVWSGTDPTNSVAEAAFTLGSGPGAVPFNQVGWTTSPYLVVGVRIYTTNLLNFSGVSNLTAIDAVQLSGTYDPTASGSLPLSGAYDPHVNRGRSDQYASLLLAQATSADSLDNGNGLGAPKVTGSNPDDPVAWSPDNQTGPPETLAVGFAIPVYADGVTIRETEGNGFVTGVDVLPEGADPLTGWVNVWTGTDPTLPGAPADFRVNWPETSFLVSAVRIDVDNNHAPAVFKAIDSVQLHGWFTPGTVVASGTGSSLTFTPSATDGNATYFATLVATDSLGNVAMAQTTIDVAPSVPATAHITNPTSSAGQVGLTLTATDPAPGDQAASFTIDWGDGSGVQTVTATNGTGTPVHSYAGAGTYVVIVTATDTAGRTSGIATAVVFLSTAPADHILLGGGISPGQVSIGTAATSSLIYSPTDLVFVAGQDSGDTYTVNFGHNLTTPITIAASGGALLANGADGDNYFNKVLGTPNQLSWAPVYGAATPVETVTFTGTSTQILVGGSGNNYFIDPGSGTTLDGGPAANTFVITATSGTGVTLVGGPSTNNYVIDLGSLAGPVTIQNSNPGASDGLTVNGGPGNNTIAFSGAQVTAGSQSINVNAALTNVTINGGPGNNQISVGNLTAPVQNLAVNGGGGTNTITLVNLGASVSSLTVSGGAGTTQVQVQGSLPAHVHLPASQVAFTVAPTSTFAGFNLNSPNGVQVSVEDQLGNVETGDTSTVTVAISSGPPGGAFLSGSTTSARAHNGVATFPNLAINLAGTYTLKASDGSLTIATATVVIQPNTGILLLDPTRQSLTVSANASLNVTNYGAIVIDSSNSAAVSASANASITATEIDVHGGLSASSLTAIHGVTNQGAAALADPLANLAAPSQPSTQFTAVNYSGTLQPGTYVGGITVSGSSSVTLQPGLYYLKGGGLTVTGSATVTGTGVMLYLTGINSTSVSISGNASVTLTPPTSGLYQGVVLFQDRTSNAAITISGKGVLNTTGTEYAPGATVTLSGTSDTDDPTHTSLGAQWIVDDLVLSGNAKITISANANNRSQNPNAFLVAGGPVQPAMPVALLTPAEAQAAVKTAVALWSAAGVDAGTLQALSRAAVTIAPLPAPYLGLAAPGAIYLDPTAEGHGWFTGLTSATAPPAGQIDLLTVVAHELGHLFGLMDGDGSALMVSTLAPGTRILPSAADLLAAHTTLAALSVTAGPTATDNAAAGAEDAAATKESASVEDQAGPRLQPVQAAAPLLERAATVDVPGDPQVVPPGVVVALAGNRPPTLPQEEIDFGFVVNTAQAGTDNIVQGASTRHSALVGGQGGIGSEELANDPLASVTVAYRAQARTRFSGPEGSVPGSTQVSRYGGAVDILFQGGPVGNATSLGDRGVDLARLGGSFPAEGWEFPQMDGPRRETARGLTLGELAAAGAVLFGLLGAAWNEPAPEDESGWRPRRQS
jgi:hypothetical protein